jgi:aconitase A
MNFLAAPEIVTAMTFSGKLSFNPMTDVLKDQNGNDFQFQPPQGDDLPGQGFDAGRATYEPPSPTPTPDQSVEIKVDPASNRLQVLDPFEPWNGEEIKNLRVLVKVHLQNIAENTLIGALNADNGKVNVVTDFSSGQEGSIPEVAKSYKSQNQPWLVIADVSLSFMAFLHFFFWITRLTVFINLEMY